ncbi:MAG: peptide-binding protein [Clostridia bacterium]|nr:peptide-binding protein [Clostridia bacterium]
MKKKILPLIALLLVLAMVLSACGAPANNNASSNNTNTEPVQEDKHLNVAIYWNANVDTMNGWGGWWTMRYGIGETLLTMDANMKLVECLADSWSVGEDHMTFKFHIRKGVKFSNGDDLTPQHVVDSIKRIAENNSRGGNLKLASAEVDGEYAVFHTTEEYSAFPYMITEPMCIIVNTAKDMSNYDIYPICTGPYKVIGHVKDETWDLEANEYYWKGVPKIKYITNYNIAGDSRVAALISGQIDMAYSPSTATLSLLKDHPELKRIDALGTRESDIAINCREGRPTANKDLRLALAYALDRKVLAQISGNGTAEPLSRCFPDSVGYDFTGVTTPDYDKAKAEEHLKLAGYTEKDAEGYVLDKDGKRLTLKILLSSSSNTAVFVSMIDMWKEVGIHVELDPMENVKDKRSSGDFDILGNAGWQTMNNGDGQSYMTNRWTAVGPDNYVGYTTPEFEDVMKRLNQAFDPAERSKLYAEAAQIIANDCPAIFYAATANYDVINTNRMNDIVIYPIDYYVVDNTWTMK